MRRNAAAFVEGDTLEFAVGSGLQMESYDWKSIDSYVAIDNSEGMLSIARDRLGKILSEAPRQTKKEVSLLFDDAENVRNIDNNKKVRHCIAFEILEF